MRARGVRVLRGRRRSPGAGPLRVAQQGRGPARAAARRRPAVRRVRPVRRPPNQRYTCRAETSADRYRYVATCPSPGAALRAPPHRRPAQVARPRTARPRPAACAGSRSTAARCARPSRSRCGRPADVRDGVPLPLLAVHDGPEYDAPAALTALARRRDRRGRAAAAPGRPARTPATATSGTPPRRSYARALSGEVLPAIGRAVAVAGPPAGMGASLGGLAMLHAQRRYPGRVRRRCSCSPARSSSRATTHMEQRLRRATGGSCASCARRVRDGQYAMPVPATITVRPRGGERPQQPRIMARALAAQGYDVSLEEVPDLHNYVGWRRRFRPAPDRARCSEPGALMNAPPRRAVLATRSARTAPSPPTATTAGRCSRSPSEARARVGLREQRHGRRGRRS